MTVIDTEHLYANAAQWTRSAASLEFEALWRELRSDTLVPSRDAFHPSLVARFMHDIVVTNAAPDGNGLTIRLSGDRVVQLAGRNLAGENYLNFLPPQYHDGALATGHLMANHPCGLWQITPAHLASGVVVHLEVTVFPLGPNAHTGACLLAHARRIGQPSLPAHPSSSRFAVDTAATFRFLDVGAGEPEWPLAA